MDVTIPSSPTIFHLFHILSDYLIKETIQIPKEGEIIQVIGLLGNEGKMPFRIRMLNQDELKIAVNEYSLPFPDVPIMFVDIPDIEGHFVTEEECAESVKKHYHLYDLKAEDENDQIQD